MIRIIPLIFIILLLSNCEDSCELNFDGINPRVQNVYEEFHKVDSLVGKITNSEMWSEALKENRKISIYQPPNYDTNSTYGILFVTDGVASFLAPEIEYLIIEKKIEPIFIVGIHNRETQLIDSIFSETIYDFRAMEFFKDEILFKNGSGNIVLISENEEIAQNPILLEILSNRYTKFSTHITNEVIPHVIEKYSITTNHEKWTLGGFSNGGAYVYSYSCDNPGVFGNSIVMSPAGPFATYDFKNSTSNYFIAAGNNESFHAESIRYLPIFDELKIPYIHRTFDAGHDWQMWLTFYLQSIEKIYCNK